MPESKKKSKVLTLEVLVEDETLYQRTAEQRQNFLVGYISSIPGCTVVDAKIEEAEVINIDNKRTVDGDK
jgi:hypothetical protein